MTLRLAAPGIFLAGLLLLPFLNKPFTIDDPLFMREAAHALVDPLHPADFEQVWNAGDRQKLSQFLLGGTLSRPTSWRPWRRSAGANGSRTSTSSCCFADS